MSDLYSIHSWTQCRSIDVKKRRFIPHNQRLVATAAKRSGKRMINGCAAIAMRQSDYHIDSLPDGLSSLITSWAIEKYLFQTPMWGWETNVAPQPARR